MRYAMIMAGGAGTRLWPMSRNQRPKQLLPLIAGARPGDPARSLLEVAAARMEGLVPPERRYICTAEAFRAQIKASLPAFSDDRILGEPCGRDTVNAVGFGAAVFHKLHKDAVFCILTADHLISPEEVFRERAELAFRLVEQDPRRLVTFSIKPTYAATGFGYVERGPAIHGVTDSKGREIAESRSLAFRVSRFVEKPDLPRAQAYYESGHFGWNSGMFVFHAGTFLECLKKYKPESFEGLMKIQQAWGTREQQRVLEEVYPTLPRISVDYAVMEPASREKEPGGVTVCTVNTDVSWLDVGSWPSYGETLKADAGGNRLGAAAADATTLLECRDTLVVNDDPSHTVAALGVRDLIIVHTRDATLVMPRAHAEALKQLHALVRNDLK